MPPVPSHWPTTSAGPPLGEKSTRILSPCGTAATFHGLPSSSAPVMIALRPASVIRRVQPGCAGSEYVPWKRTPMRSRGARRSFGSLPVWTPAAVPPASMRAPAPGERSRQDGDVACATRHGRILRVARARCGEGVLCELRRTGSSVGRERQSGDRARSVRREVAARDHRRQLQRVGAGEESEAKRDQTKHGRVGGKCRTFSGFQDEVGARCVVPWSYPTVEK